MDMGTIYDCSVNPAPGGPILALATTAGVCCLPSLESPERQVLYRSQAYSKTDTLSVEWISRNVIAGGRRDGGIHLYDVRVNPERSILRLQHGQKHSRPHATRGSKEDHPFHATVNKLRRVDESRIVAAGCNFVHYSLIRYQKCTELGTDTKG